MIEVLIAAAGVVFGGLLATIIWAKVSKREEDHAETKTQKNADFERLQAAIDDLRGNPVAVDDKIREWLRK